MNVCNAGSSDKSAVLVPQSGAWFRLAGAMIAIVTACVITVASRSRAVATDHPSAPRSKGWNSAVRPKSRSPQLSLVKSSRSYQDSPEPAEDTDSELPIQAAPESANSDAEEDLTSPADHELSVTERLKQALQTERESRHTTPDVPASTDERASADEHPNPAPSQESGSASPPLEADLASPDPRQREKADRFLRLKMLLLQFKNQVQTNSAATIVPPETVAEPGTEIGKPEREPVHESHQTDEPDEIKGKHETHGTDAMDGAHDTDESRESDQADGVTESHGTADHSDADYHGLLPTRSDPAGGAHPAAPGHQQMPVRTPNSVRPSMTDQAVVDGPIDRLGLANNLYAVGDYLLALKMYEQADAASMTAQQQIWTEYQIANCLRRTGKLAEASNRYRLLADQPAAGWLSEQSQWWVDVLEKMRTVRKGLEEKVEVESATK